MYTMCVCKYIHVMCIYMYVCIYTTVVVAIMDGA